MMPVTELKSFLKNLDLFLNEAGVQYAIARNAKSLPDSLVGNDIDLLVNGENRDKLNEILKDKFSSYLYKIVQKPTAIHVFFMNIANGSSIFLQVDFIFSFHFRGAVFCDSEKLLGSRVRENDLWILNDIDSMALVFVSKGIIHLSVPKKYKIQIKSIPRAEFLNRVNYLVGYRVIQEEEYDRFLIDDEAFFKRPRRHHIVHCWVRGFRASLSRFLKFSFYELRASLPCMSQSIIVVPDCFCQTGDYDGIFKGCATEWYFFKDRNLLKFYYTYSKPSRKIRATLIAKSFANKLNFNDVTEVRLNKDCIFYAVGVCDVSRTNHLE